MNPSPMAKSSSGVQPDWGSGSSLTGVGVGVAGKGGTVDATAGVWLPPAGAMGVEVAEKAGRVLVRVGSGGVAVGEAVGVALGVDMGAGGAGVGSMMGVTGTPVGVGGVVAVGNGVNVGSGVQVGKGVSLGSGVLMGVAGRGVLVAVGGRVTVQVGDGIRVAVGLGVGSPWAREGEACQRTAHSARTPSSGGANRKA